MKKLNIFLIMIIITSLLTACNQGENKNLLPLLKDDGKLTYTTSTLIYQNDGSTLYSIGGVGSVFVFSNDTLTVEDGEKTTVFGISYDEIPLTAESFQKQFQDGEQIPKISSYQNLLQYNLCESTNQLPGYRLYILDDQYWIATIYKGSVWRIVS